MNEREYNSYLKLKKENKSVKKENVKLKDVNDKLCRDLTIQVAKNKHLLEQLRIK